VVPDSVSEATGGLVIKDRFIIGAPPAGAGAEREKFYLPRKSGAGIDRYVCRVDGLKKFDWCTPRLVVDAEGRLGLRVVANNGALVNVLLEKSAPRDTTARRRGDAGAPAAGGAASAGGGAGSKRKRGGTRGATRQHAPVLAVSGKQLELNMLAMAAAAALGDDSEAGAQAGDDDSETETDASG
jgi:hypothetical protein